MKKLFSSMIHVVKNATLKSSPIVILTFLTSCYGTQYTYLGSSHQDYMGKTKNDILRNYGVPDRIIDDGNGGSILSYEKSTLTTISNNTTNAFGTSKSYGAAVYNNSGIIAGNVGKFGYSENTSGVSETSVKKTFLYFYINNDNVAYDFKTNSNFGARYKAETCFDDVTTWTSVVIGGIVFFPSAIVTIPLSISAKNRAIKRGIKKCQ